MTLYYTKPGPKNTGSCGCPGNPMQPVTQAPEPDCPDPPPSNCDPGPTQTATTVNDPDDCDTWQAIGGKTTWIKKGNVLVGFVQPNGEVCKLTDEVSPETEGCTAEVDADGCASVDLKALASPNQNPIDFRTFQIKEFPEEGTVSNDGSGTIKFKGKITEPQKLKFCVSDTAGNQSNVSCIIFLPKDC